MSRREQLLRAMGLAPLWKLRSAPAASLQAGDTASAPPTAPTLPAAASQPPGAIDDRSARIARMDWAELKQATAECRACGLWAQRKQAVLGVGDVRADWLFVGEGPGAEEDERGEPFVGQAGKLLDSMLAALGLARGRGVYIANTVKCRPPGNRTPEPDEMAACFPFLARQIELIAPRIIVALGRPAAQALLGTEVKIAAARGRLFEHRGIPLVVTYHPAYLLRNLPDKAKAWEDFCFARAALRARAGEGLSGPN